MRTVHGVVISPIRGAAKIFMLRALLLTKSPSEGAKPCAQCADEESRTMNDMSAPKLAGQRKKLDEAAYDTVFARTAKVFDPSERILADIAELAPTIAAHAAEI